MEVEGFTPAQQKVRVITMVVASLVWGVLLDFTTKPWHPWMFGALAIVILWTQATPQGFKKVLPAWIVIVILAMSVYGIILFR